MEIFLCMFSSVSMLQTSTRAFNVFNLSSLAFKTNSQTTENNIFFFTFSKKSICDADVGSADCDANSMANFKSSCFSCGEEIFIFLMEQFDDSCMKIFLCA